MTKSGEKVVKYKKNYVGHTCLTIKKIPSPMGRVLAGRVGVNKLQNAIEQAKKCEKDVPIGCVIKKDGHIVAATHNRRELDNDITAHAEMLAIKEAQNGLNTSRLNDCEMYVTLEPCPMCAWAIVQSGIKRVYFGSYNPNYGALLSNPLTQINSSIHLPQVYGGIEEETCNEILEKFFKGLR